MLDCGNTEATVADEQSLITDEHRAFIGRKSEPVVVTVKAEDSRRMREVINDEDPHWNDGSSVPPYLIAGLGIARQGGFVPVILPNSILTQQEWRFTRPFQAGEDLSAIAQVVDVRERLGGRYGHSILITISTDYYDTNNDHVCAALITLTQFDPNGGPGGDS